MNIIKNLSIELSQEDIFAALKTYIESTTEHKVESFDISISPASGVGGDRFEYSPYVPAFIKKLTIKLK